MNAYLRSVPVTFLVLFLTISTLAQSGGTFIITKSVITGGNVSGDGGGNTLFGADTGTSGDINYGPGIGSGATVFANNTIVIDRSDGNDFVVISGLPAIANLAVTGPTSLCRNKFVRVGHFLPLLGTKSNIITLTWGLRLIARLRPVSYNRLKGATPDFGLAAEVVAEVEPLLTTRNVKVAFRV